MDNPTLLDYDFVYCGDADEWFAAQTTKVTLRDLFAGLAMAGKLTRGYGPSAAAEVARQAYAFADAMLAERVK